ncbi:hypothetical protein WOSG25_050260 [Weissella oryzae SG25]|uniref:Uncharacterized protein n=1 Tax=Weissella oryzae (strain DSM 25784 / JCM 18191 / LMG 30913 / SG25) TaxID=1329250 RepID=A0A069CTG7_WEIOS|nr:hypothetical protein [Weissella oryzae]GAK30754.1 hypothetical protein WOSG25_050260 [Weissella oryzae SG25]
MQEIFIKMRDRTGINHTFKYPWLNEEIYRFAKKSVGQAYIVGLTSDVKLIVHVTDLRERLPIIDNIIRLKNAGISLVYAPSRLEAVRMLFKYDIRKAALSVFEPSNLPISITWAKIVERLIAINRLKDLGLNYYADMKELNK